MFFSADGSPSHQWGGYLEENEVLSRRRSLVLFLQAAARIVLEALNDVTEALGHPLGATKLVAFLGGAETAFIRANDLDTLPHYGVFENFRRAWIFRLAEALRETAYLEVGEGFRPVLRISPEAADLLSCPEELPLFSLDIVADLTLGPSCPRSSLEEELRRVRGRLARTLKRNPKSFVSDEVLRAMARGVLETREEVEAGLPEAAKPHAEAFWSVLLRSRAEGEPPLAVRRAGS